MEQFSLEKYLENLNRKVITRDGREVEIYYSPTSRIPLIGRTSDNEIHQYTKDGFQCDTFNQAKNDLFFADEEERLTEFEQEIKNWMSEFLLSTEQPVSNEIVKKAAQNVLDLARRELQPEFEKELDEAYKTRDEVVYLEGYDNGHEDALKDLPKWKKATESKNFDNHIILFEDKDRVVLTTEIYENERYIKLDDLKTLPEEE